MHQIIIGPPGRTLELVVASLQTNRLVLILLEGWASPRNCPQQALQVTSASPARLRGEASLGRRPDLTDSSPQGGKMKLLVASVVI